MSDEVFEFLLDFRDEWEVLAAVAQKYLDVVHVVILCEVLGQRVCAEFRVHEFLRIERWVCRGAIYLKNERFGQILQKQRAKKQVAKHRLLYYPECLSEHIETRIQRQLWPALDSHQRLHNSGQISIVDEGVYEKSVDAFIT